MNILMLADLYPPIIGGGEIHVESLSRALAERGHKVTVCTVTVPGAAGREQEQRVQIYRVSGLIDRLSFLFQDKNKRWHPPMADPLLARTIEHIICSEKPDVIHAHGRIVYSFLALKPRVRVPLALTLHAYWAICPKSSLTRGSVPCSRPLNWTCVPCAKATYGLPKSLFAYLFTRRNKPALRWVDRFVAVSSCVKEVHVKNLGVDARKICVIPNFSCEAKPASINISPSFPDDFVLFVGNFIPAKGVDVLVQAYRGLATETKLVLVGTKHPAHHYSSAGNIVVRTNVPHDVVMDAMSRCKFVVLPSVWPEPCATVALEAMSQKKAVIATEIGGFTDIVVQGETGILVPPGNASALSEAIRLLLENPSQAEAMGRNGYRRWVEHFSSDAVVPQIEKLYYSLL